MKKFINKIVVVLAMTSAMVANVNAATPAQVQAKVNQVIGNLTQSRTAYSTTQRNQDVVLLNKYAQEYPAIRGDINAIVSALNLASGDARKMQSQPNGNAYRAQQNINAILNSASMSRPMTQAPAVTPALINQQTKEVDKAVADLQLAQKQAADKAEQAQKKIIAAKTETAKQNAQLNADKAVEMANSKVNEKTQIATAKLQELQNSVAQSNQQAIIEDAQKIVVLKEQKDLATNAAAKQEIAGEITMLDAQMTQEEQEQGTTGWKASILKAVSTYKNALVALGVGVTGTVAAYGAYKMGYLPSTETMQHYGRTGMDYVSSTANAAYNSLPSLRSNSALGVGAAGATAVVGTALGVNKYRTMEKEVTPTEVTQSAAALEMANKTVNATETAAQKNPNEVNLQKVADAKANLEVKAARAADDLAALRTWTGDLKGYSLEDVNRAKVALGLLYPQEKQLKEHLNTAKTNKEYIAKYPKADQVTHINRLTTELKQVQQQIHDNEVITGKRYANAIKRSFYALTGAAVLGAAAATDYYFNEGNLMKSAAGYGSAALATGAGYARSGWNTASGYGRSLADKASNILPDKNTFSKYAPDSNTPSRLYNSAAAKAQAAKEATQRLWYGTPDPIKNLGPNVETAIATKKTVDYFTATNPDRTLDPAMTEVYGSENSYLGQIGNPVTSAVKNSAARAALGAQQNQVAPTTRQFQGANVIRDARTGQLRAPTMAEQKAMRNAQ